MRRFVYSFMRLFVDAGFGVIVHLCKSAQSVVQKPRKAAKSQSGEKAKSELSLLTCNPSASLASLRLCVPTKKNGCSLAKPLNRKAEKKRTEKSELFLLTCNPSASLASLRLCVPTKNRMLSRKAAKSQRVEKKRTSQNPTKNRCLPKQTPVLCV